MQGGVPVEPGWRASVRSMTELKTCYVHVAGCAAVLEVRNAEPNEVLTTIREIAKTSNTLRQIHDGRTAVLVDLSAVPITVTIEPPPDGTPRVTVWQGLAATKERSAVMPSVGRARSTASR